MLTISQLSLTRGGKPLFDQVDLALAPGHRLGVTGPNGCGKSSLFAVIAGTLEADQGSVEVPRDWCIVQIEQESPHGGARALDFVLAADERLTRLNREMADAEAAGQHERLAQLHHDAEVLDAHTAASRAARLLAGLGFSEDEQARPVETFSGGWRARLALARALFQPSDLLMLDEPTNHLDLETIVWLEDWLRRYPGVVLVISHDRDFLDAVTTHTAWYDQGRVRVMAGDYSEVEAKRAQVAEQQAAEFRKQQARAKELTRFVDRFRYKASKASQAQSRLKMLERLTAAAPAHARAGYRFRFPDAEKISSPLITFDQASAGYDGVPVIQDIRLGIQPGERIGLLGRNGAGKSTLVKLIAGEAAPLSGGRVTGRHFQPGYFTQHQLEQFDYARTPLEHLEDLAPDASGQQLRDFLGGFGFHGDMATEPVAPRSGGEKARLALALMAWRRPNLLILDEPTNHLDLDMRHELALALQEFAGALVLVSHDRSLLTACCDRFLLVHDGRVDEFDGDLGDYARVLAARDRALDGPQDGSSRAPGQKAKRQQAARERERLKPLRNQVRSLERKMEEEREHLDQVRNRLADPALYDEDHRDEVKRLNRECSEAEKRLGDLEHEWLEASEALETAGAEFE